MEASNNDLGVSVSNYCVEEEGSEGEGQADEVKGHLKTNNIHPESSKVRVI